MGRPSKRTTERLQTVLVALRGGASRKAAAAAGGVDASTLRRWVSDRAAVRQAVAEAEGHCEETLVRVIAACAAGGDWRAAAHLLAVRFPADWSPNVRLRAEVSGPGGEPVKLQHDHS